MTSKLIPEVNLPARITKVILALLFCLTFGFSFSYGQQEELWEDDPFDFSQSKSNKQDESTDEIGPEILEPFFAQILSWSSGDSLGTWDGSKVAEFAEAAGRPSRFPIEKLLTFSRLRPTPEDEKAWPGVNIVAVWDVQLSGPQDPPMPYSIFGYHPGTLRVSERLRLAETDLGAMGLRNENEHVIITEIRLFRIEQGAVILDVDGWLDRIMGKKLDDAAVVGFVSAREEGRLISLAVSLGDEGREIVGEFDLRHDKVLPNGRSVIYALSDACRAIFYLGLEDPLDKAWERGVIR